MKRWLMRLAARLDPPKVRDVRGEGELWRRIVYRNARWPKREDVTR